MQIFRLLYQVDNVDELSATHEAHENHNSEENVDVFAEEDSGVKYVEDK